MTCWHPNCFAFQVTTPNERDRPNSTVMFLPFPDQARSVQDSIALGRVQLCLRLRLVRTGLAWICVTSVLLTKDACIGACVVFVAASLGWPWLAKTWVMRSRDQGLVEIRCLLIDSVLGGAAVALMQFNLLPSALLTVMLASDKVIVGGWNLMLRGLLVQVAACVVTLAIHGVAFAPQTSVFQMLVTLPMLIGYPLAVSVFGCRLLDGRAFRSHRSRPMVPADEPSSG